MKKEIEIRILNIDKDSFINNIVALGGKKENEFLQRRFVYDFNPIQNNKWIRLRTNGFKTTLAIKEIVDKNIISGTNEMEIVVSDFDQTNEILEELGYKHRNYQENYREIYRLNDVEISVDTWPLIPTYVELEADNEDAIKNILSIINYNTNDLTTLDVTSIYSDIYNINIMSIKELKFEENRKSMLEHNK